MINFGCFFFICSKLQWVITNSFVIFIYLFIYLFIYFYSFVITWTISLFFAPPASPQPTIPMRWFNEITGYTILETGDLRQETWDRKCETRDVRQETWFRRHETGDRRWETGDRRCETGDRRCETKGTRQETWMIQETGDMRQETGGMRQEMWDRIHDARYVRQETWGRIWYKGHVLRDMIQSQTAKQLFLPAIHYQTFWYTTLQEQKRLGQIPGEKSPCLISNTLVIN